MALYVYLDVDIESCRTCAVALDALAENAESGFDRFREAREKSESVWDGGSGDAFRGTISDLAKAAEQVSDKSRDLAKTLRVFADSMSTAKEHLNRAVALALEAGIPAGPDVCNALYIGDPEPLNPTGPWSIQQQTEYANQVAAYNDAVDMVDEARRIEADAHTALQTAFEDTDGLVDRLRSSAPWMAAGGALSYLGTAAQQANQWGATAEARVAQLARFTAIAAEPASAAYTAAAARTLPAFAPAADDAVRNVAQNKALLPGQLLPKLGNWAAEGLPFGGSVGAKIPIVGVGITAAQTVNDLRDAENVGDATKIIAKDAGGFLAGTAATTLILGSVAGGPATVAAVGVGVLVTYGVGELIELVAD